MSSRPNGAPTPSWISTSSRRLTMIKRSSPSASLRTSGAPSSSKIIQLTRLLSLVFKPPGEDSGSGFHSRRIFIDANAEICIFLVKADSDSKAKYTYALMLLWHQKPVKGYPSRLAEAIGWNSPHLSYKFFRKAIEPRSREASLPGSVSLEDKTSSPLGRDFQEGKNKSPRKF